MINNISQNIFKILLFFYFLIFLKAADCPIPRENQTQLYSDAIQIRSQNNQGKQDLVFNYQFNESFNTIPSVAFGINEFVSTESPLLEIKIENAKVKEDGIYFRVQSGEESQWKSLRINFISTTRADMEFGTASFTNAKSQNTTGQVFEIAYPLEKDFKSVGLKIKPFIQSFNLESTDKQNIGIKLQDADVEGKKVYFSFANPRRVSLVRSLTLSIIVFNIYTPGVLYADGIIDQNYVTSKIEIHIPRHGISELRTYIVGINSFHASAAQPISISSAIDETFTLLIGPIDRQQIDFVSISYLILSVIDCGSCAGYPVLFKGICKLECPFGYTEKNGKCIPIDCSNGFELGPEGICVPECGENEEYSTALDKCVCIDNYYPIAGVCTQCYPGTYYNFRTMTCDSLCGSNSYYQGGRCFCNPGYYVINNTCQSCPKGTLFSQQTKQCQSICQLNQIFVDSKCRCKQNFYNLSGACNPCPKGTIYDQQNMQCICQKVLEKFNIEKNKCLPTCTQFEILKNQKCECKDEYIRIKGFCSQCPKFSLFDIYTEDCICSAGLLKINNECVCPDHQILLQPGSDQFSNFQTNQQINQISGQFLNEPNQRFLQNQQFFVEQLDSPNFQCVDRCTEKNEIWINNICDCRQNEKRNQNGVCFPECGEKEVRFGGTCICIDGYYKGVYGPCVPIKCPDGFQWNSRRRQCESVCRGYNQVMVNGVCQCVAGFSRQLTYGICLPSCPDNQVRKNGVCQCSPGNKIIDGVCTNCPRYTQYVNGVCLCYNGRLPIDGECQVLSCPDINHVYDSISRTCRCKGPLTWMRGRCQYIRGCGQNQYWCGTACVCHYGYHKVNEKCEMSTATIPECPPYSKFDIVSYKCVCDQGFHPVRPYICQKCPVGYWDGYKCNNDKNQVCAQGYIYDFFTSSCILDQTTGCGSNEFLDGIHCRCKLGYFWINSSCQKCAYGTYFDGLSCSDSNVQQCADPYKFWNGNGCVCLPDFFEYGDTCVRCPANTVWNGICCKVPLPHIGPLAVINGF